MSQICALERGLDYAPAFLEFILTASSEEMLSGGHLVEGYLSGTIIGWLDRY